MSEDAAKARAQKYQKLAERLNAIHRRYGIHESGNMLSASEDVFQMWVRGMSHVVRLFMTLPDGDSDYDEARHAAEAAERMYMFLVWILHSENPVTDTQLVRLFSLAMTYGMAVGRWLNSDATVRAQQRVADTQKGAREANVVRDKKRAVAQAAAALIWQKEFKIHNSVTTADIAVHMECGHSLSTVSAWRRAGAFGWVSQSIKLKRQRSDS